MEKKNMAMNLSNTQIKQKKECKINKYWILQKNYNEYCNQTTLTDLIKMLIDFFFITFKLPPNG